MIRISLPWMIQIHQAVDSLEIESGIPKAQVWPSAFHLRSQLEDLFNQSLYRDSLVSSRGPADELYDALSVVIDDENKDGLLSEIEVWKLRYSRDNFRTIFLAELAILPCYYVLPKPPYSTAILLEGGEALMPTQLATKVPEAVFDAKEAAKALAFELGTACGFHTFRVLESVVRRYYTIISDGKSEPKQRNLGVYIRALKAHDANEKIIAALQQLKDLHRNPLVHPQVAIPIEESISILGMVRSVVAAMLNELPDIPLTTTTT
ncbi:hypothetical protein [Hoeflea sp.]|uniref:hypothetical protein n=1 Tax=Hoeflea sp. TaxID=1940281 RepID=UPI003A92DAF3